MERHAAGTARVVPIIVRKCDWETATFAKCQGFPRDNKAVATHPDGEDAALTEVAKELRKLARDIIDDRSTPTSATGKPAEIFCPKTWWQRHRRALFAGTGVVMALVLVAGTIAFLQSRAATLEGNRDLRLAAYERAANRFAVAARWNPLSSDARWGARLASLGAKISDMEHQGADFSRELEALERQRANDPVVRLFAGDRAFDAYRRGNGMENLAAAVTAYSAAAQSDDAFPEAHARLGFLADLGGDLPASEQEWRKAVAQLRNDAPLAMKYRNGLAGVLAQLGHTEQALRLYDGDPEHARSIIEAAMLRWQGPPTYDVLGQARDRLEQVHSHLAGTGAADAWGFKAGGELVFFGRIEAHRCLAAVALATTNHMLSRHQSASTEPDEVIFGVDCQEGQADILLVICDRLTLAAAPINTRAEAARAWLHCPATAQREKLPAEQPASGRQVTRRTQT